MVRSRLVHDLEKPPLSIGESASSSAARALREFDDREAESIPQSSARGA